MEIKHSLKIAPHNRKNESPNIECPIRIRVSYANIRIDFSTSFYVSLANWNKNTNKAESPKKYLNRFGQSDSVINEGIQKRITIINELFKKYEYLNVIPTSELFRSDFNKECSVSNSEKTSEEAKTILDFFDEFVSENGKNRNWAIATYKKFASLRMQLIEFKKYGKYDKFDFDTFDESALNNMVDYYRVKRKMKNSSIGKHIALIKWFFRWASKRGYNKNNAFELFSLKLKRIQNDVVFLTQEELHKLMDYEVPKTKAYLQKVKDVFVFCCYTGIRYSDVKNLKREDVKQDCIEITTIKTSDKLKIELNKNSKAILEKYKKAHLDDGQALPVISNQKMNMFLKELMQAAGIDEPVKRVYYRGDKREEEILPKYNYIGTHTARRTFICSALGLGIPIHVVMKWTGHSNYKAMQPYIDASDDIKRKQMNKFNEL